MCASVIHLGTPCSKRLLCEGTDAVFDTLALFPDPIHSVPPIGRYDWAILDSRLFTPELYEVYDAKSSERFLVQCISENDRKLIKGMESSGRIVCKLEATVNYPLVIKDYSERLVSYGAKVIIVDLWSALLDVRLSGQELNDPDWVRAINFSTALYYLRQFVHFKIVTPPCECICISEDRLDYPGVCWDYLSDRVVSIIRGAPPDKTLKWKAIRHMRNAFSEYTTSLSSDEKSDFRKLKKLFLDSSTSDSEDTFKLATALALTGHFGGCGILGRMYKQGLFVEKNQSLAAFWLRKASKTPYWGLFYSKYAETMALPEYSMDSVLVLESLLKKGDYKVHFALGRDYLRGIGVDQDPIAASDYLNTAYENGVKGSDIILMESLWDAGTRDSHEKLLYYCETGHFEEIPEKDFYLGMVFGFDSDHRNMAAAEYHFKKAFRMGLELALEKHLCMLWESKTPSALKKIVNLFETYPEKDVAKGYYALAISAGPIGHWYSKSRSLLSELGSEDPIRLRYLTDDGFLVSYSENLISFDRRIICSPSWIDRLSGYASARGYSISDEFRGLSERSYLVIDAEDHAYVDDVLKGFPNDRIVFVSNPLKTDKAGKRAALYGCQIEHPGSSIANGVPTLFRTLDRKISQHEAKALSDFEVKSVVAGRHIRSKVTLGKSISKYSGKLSFTFQLYHDNQAIGGKGSRFRSVEFKLGEDGIYAVQASVTLGQYTARLRSNAVSYFSEDFRERADRFLDSKPVFESKFVLLPQSMPFQDILVHVSHQDGPASVPCGLPNAVPMEIEGLGRVDVYSAESRRFGSVVQAFSGICRLDDRIALTGDVDDSIDDSHYGCFTCVSADTDNQTVRFFHDFCGYGKLYIYSDETDSYVSNRYSFLLSVLKAAGKQLSFDREKVITGLSSVNQVLLQNFSRTMDVPEIKQLEPCYEVRISRSALEIVGNKMHEILVKPHSPDVREYDALLDEASSEIERNIRCALNTFGAVQEDLSGGMDSRLVLSVSEGMDIPSDAVRLNIRGPADSGDVKMGLKVSSYSRFGFVSDKIDARYGSMVHVSMGFRNHFLGQYYSYGLNRIHAIDPVCKLTGGNGDAFGRPEYGRHYFGDVGELSETAEEMVKFAWQKQMATGVILDSDNPELYFRNTVSKEIRVMPSESPVSNYDLMYLFYRNGYHFDPAMILGTNFLNWMPLQSAKLFEANCLTRDAFRSARLELEMIHINNPTMGAVEYQSPRDMQDYSRIMEELRHVALGDSVPRERLAEYEDANSKRGYHFINRGEPVPNEIACRALNRLSVLSRIDGGFYRERVVYSLLYFISRNQSNTSKLKMIYNKVLSITDQYSLLHSDSRNIVDITALNPYGKSVDAITGSSSSSQ